MMCLKLCPYRVWELVLFWLIFHVCVIVFVLSERFNIVVRYVSAVFPQVLEMFDVYIVWLC